MTIPCPWSKALRSNEPSGSLQGAVQIGRKGLRMRGLGTSTSDVDRDIAPPHRHPEPRKDELNRPNPTTAVLMKAIRGVAVVGIAPMVLAGCLSAWHDGMTEASGNAFAASHPGCSMRVHERRDLEVGYTSVDPPWRGMYEVNGCNRDVIYACSPGRTYHNGSHDPVDCEATARAPALPGNSAGSRDGAAGSSTVPPWVTAIEDWANSVCACPDTSCLSAAAIQVQPPSGAALATTPAWLMSRFTTAMSRGQQCALRVSSLGSSAGCSKDTDCKGDRVCVQGQCADPLAKPVAPGLRSTPSSSATAPAH